jgi:hypothetical protein
MNSLEQHTDLKDKSAALLESIIDTIKLSIHLNQQIKK